MLCSGKVWQGDNLANLVRSAKLILINHQFRYAHIYNAKHFRLPNLILAEVTHYTVYHMYMNLRVNLYVYFNVEHCNVHNLIGHEGVLMVMLGCLFYLNI